MHTLAAQGVMRGELEIAFVGKTDMKRLHARWLGDDTPTDVMTFDLRGPMRGTDRKKIVDGQMVVCTPVAREEARRRRVPWAHELLLYVIHGCLHLCGYDDRRARDAAAMGRRQARLLMEMVAP